MKTLYLHLKKRWFGMIQSGKKLEEYRDISKYYISRLMNFSSIVGNCHRFVETAYAATHPEEDKYFKKFDKVVFFLGYPRRNDVNKRIEFDNPRIRIGHGKEEWGAEPEEYYFVITWNKK